jgi:hypothetical protein
VRRLRLGLSHPLTPAVRLVFPILMLALPVIILVQAYLHPGSVPIRAIWLGPAAAAYAAWAMGGLKVLHQEGTDLVVGGIVREVRVGAEEIEWVSRLWWARPGAVTIRFRTETPLGRTISFLPETSVLAWVGLDWLDDAPIRHLRELARLAAAKERLTSAAPARSR